MPMLWPASLRRHHILFGSIAVLLGTVAVWRGTMPAPLPELPAIAAQTRSAAPVSVWGQMLPTLIELSAAAERPLFNPDRKRAIATLAVQQQAVPARPFRQPVLLGVAGAGERRVALVRLPDEKDARRMRLGDGFDGWSISDIRRDAVVFRNGAMEHEIRLLPLKDAAGGIVGMRR
jgi:hypothetical protein